MRKSSVRIAGSRFASQKLLDRFLIDECISSGKAKQLVAASENYELLIDVISKETGINPEAVQYTMEVFLKNIKQRLANGEQVGLLGFGTFSVRKKAAGSRRIPNTGEFIQVPEGKKRLHFKPGKALKDALNTELEGKGNFPADEKLSDAIAKETGIDREDVRNVMEVSLKNIKLRLANGERVTLPDFGVFTVKEKAARSGRNPGTGGEKEIISRKLLKFTPEKVFENSVNAEQEGEDHL